MCARTCEHTRLHIHCHSCMHTNTHTHMQMQAQSYMHLCTHTCMTMHTDSCARVYACAYSTHILKHVHAYIQECTHRKYRHIDIRTHTNTYVDTPVRNLPLCDAACTFYCSYWGQHKRVLASPVLFLAVLFWRSWGGCGWQADIVVLQRVYLKSRVP